MPASADTADNDLPSLVASTAQGHDDDVLHENQQEFSDDRNLGSAVGDRIDVIWD